MNYKEREQLDRMFHPRGLAIFGAVKRMDAFAHMILLSHLVFGYQGRIYPVSAQDGEVHGLKIYQNLSEIDGPVDLASISVPAENVPAILRECLAAGVAGAEIHAAGFAETGEGQGIALQEEIAEIARQGLRIVGPNCFGLYCPKGGITLLPGLDFSKKTGPAAMISQSGGVAADFGHEAQRVGIGVSKVISFGNGCDLDAVRLLEYLAYDPETGLIAAYLEGIGDGPKFIKLVREVSAEKPVVIWKGGLTGLGAKMARSHTGSLGGQAAVWRGALRQAGAVTVEGVDEMMDTVTALSYIKSRGRRIALVGGGGAIGVFSSDLADRWGLEIPTFSPATQERLKRYFPGPGNSVANPLDTGTPVLPLETVHGLLREILTGEPVDILVLISLFHPLEVIFPTFMKMNGVNPPPRGGYLQAVLKALTALKEETGKDWSWSWTTGPIGRRISKWRARPGRCENVFRPKAYRFTPAPKGPCAAYATLGAPGPDRAEPAELTEDRMEIIDKAIKEGRTTLSESESKQVLAAYGVPVTREIAVDNREALVKAAKALGFPLVLKGNAPEISHKTEMNLIRLDIRNEQEALAAFDELMKLLAETKGNVLVQEMVTGKRELVVGLTRDPQFGPCVMFGLGGIFTEILRDVSFRVAPLEKRDALEMMQDIKGHKILEGVRGMEPADLDQLSRILIQVGQIGMDHEAVKEIDINPLILAAGGKSVAVDALVVLEPAQ